MNTKLEPLSDRSLTKLATTVFLTLLFSACASQQAIQPDIEYDCSFDYFEYSPDAPHIKTDRLSDVFVWIQTRMKGALSEPPGTSLMRQIELFHFRDQKAQRPGFVHRKIWTISAESTKNNNPMNVIIDKRDQTYYITRVEDKHVEWLDFASGVLYKLNSLCPIEEYPWLESKSEIAPSFNESDND